MDAARLTAHLEALQAIADANDGVRAAGTAGYEASVEYAAEVLREIGFSVETPEVAYTGFRELPGGELTVGNRVFRAPAEMHALIHSPGGDVHGPVVEPAQSGCEPGQYAGVAPGSIVLTVAGGCFRREQALNAVTAGAAALLVGYPDRGPNEIYRPTLIGPDGMDIPVVSVTGAAVDALRALDGDEAQLTVRTEREPATLRNVVAQLGEGPRVIMLGGHLDSVFEGPGLNDNGSGVVALLEIARSLAAQGLPDGVAVRIGLWGGEELGSIGSRAYVEGLRDDVIAYLNLDMAGSVNGEFLVYDEVGAAPGSAEITRAYEDWFATHGVRSGTTDPGGASDHYGFIQAGIPTGGLFAGLGPSGSAASPSAASPDPNAEPADPCYHLPCDDIDNVDVERVAVFAEATLDVALVLAGD